MGHSLKIFSCEFWILYILIDSYVSFLDDAMLIYDIHLTLGGADWCMLSQHCVWQDLPQFWSSNLFCLSPPIDTFFKKKIIESAKNWFIDTSRFHDYLLSRVHMQVH